MARILVVEDDEDVARLFEAVLLRKGHQVSVVYSGSAALAELEAGSYPLVISDIQMSGMNGWELLDTVRRQYEGTAVILVTGSGNEEDEKMAFARGAFAFLPKPVAMGILSGTVSAAITAQRKPERVGAR